MTSSVKALQVQGTFPLGALHSKKCSDRFTAHRNRTLCFGHCGVPEGELPGVLVPISSLCALDCCVDRHSQEYHVSSAMY